MTDAPPPPAGDEPFEPWLDVFPPDKPPNELLIGLCAGRDLAIRDTSVFTKGGSSDPRCVFSIKDRPDLKCQSTVKKKNLNPVYGETFSFELGADELEAPTLHVRCEDYDVGSAPDSMGIFDVKLRGKENKRKRKWYTLKLEEGSKDKVSGAIELVIFWRHNPALASVVSFERF
jgi:Ca2+-dependent lipid-binding protein